MKCKYGHIIGEIEWSLQLDLRGKCYISKEMQSDVRNIISDVFGTTFSVEDLLLEVVLEGFNRFVM